MTSDGAGGTFPGDVGSAGMIEAVPPEPPEPFDPQLNSMGYNLFGVLIFPSMTANPNVTLPPGGLNDVEGVDPKTLFIDDGNLVNPVALLADFGGDLPTYMPDSNKPGFADIVDQGNPEPSTVRGFTDQRGRHFSRVFMGALGTIDKGADHFCFTHPDRCFFGTGR